jgi:hypothetical protein
MNNEPLTAQKPLPDPRTHLREWMEATRPTMLENGRRAILAQQADMVAKGIIKPLETEYGLPPEEAPKFKKALRQFEASERKAGKITRVRSGHDLLK